MHTHCPHCVLKAMIEMGLKSEGAYINKMAPKPSYTEIRLIDFRGNTVLLYRCKVCKLVQGI